MLQRRLLITSFAPVNWLRSGRIDYLTAFTGYSASIIKNILIFYKKFPNIFFLKASAFSATCTLVGHYSRISSTSPHTRLWSFQGLSAAPPVSPNLDSALLITKLSIAPASPRLLLLATESAQQLYFLPQGFARQVALPGAARYPNVSVLRYPPSTFRRFSARTSHPFCTELPISICPFFKVQSFPVLGTLRGW